MRSRAYHFVGLRTIQLDAVVGSEGRWRDFSRSFLPQRRHQPRLRRLLSAGPQVWKRPIEVFQLDQVFFVRDGHHRVALARRRGELEIAALVTRVEARAAITAELAPDQVMSRAQLSYFLAQTNLDAHTPQTDFRLERGELYATLLQHIDTHRFYLGLDHNREFSLAEAAASWHDLVYRPVVDVLDRTGLSREFPLRTPAELYLWITHHREQLRCREGGEVSDAEVARALARRFSERPGADLWKWLLRVTSAAWTALWETPEPPPLPRRLPGKA